MGSGHTTLKPAVLAEIASHTKFSENEAKDLYRLFLDEAVVNGKHSYTLTINNFVRIFAASFPGQDCEKFARLVFRFYDKNGSDDIDFREFLMGLNQLLTADPEMLMLNAYAFLDIHQKGLISYDGTIEAIQSLYDLHSGYLPLEGIVDAEKYAERIFVRAGRKDQGTMNLPAFKNVVRNSQTARTLVEAIGRAACRPYWDRQADTGTMGRRRAQSVIARKPSHSSKSNIPMRKFTV